MHAVGCFVIVYFACVVARRAEEALDAGDEILRRAQGTRREFVLIDWLPGQ